MSRCLIPFRTIERSSRAIAFDGLEFVTVKSSALRRRADVTLWVPGSAKDVGDLPIVTLLHGVYGSHWAWALKGGVHLLADRLIQSGQIPPLALLMPSDGLWGDGSGYVAHEDADYERWIVDEVPALAEHLVEQCTSQSPRFLAGLSMGGFGALTLAGKHRGQFAAAAAHSSVTDAWQLDELIDEGRKGWSTRAADRSVLDALTGGCGRLPPLRFDCGLEDPLLGANRALHRALQTCGIVHDYAEYPGGHDWTYWSRQIEQSLLFFGRVLEP